MDEARALTVDPAALSHDARLDALEALQRHRAILDAQEQRVLAAVADSDERVEQWVREEVSVVLRISPQTAGARLRVAQELLHRLPGTVEAMKAGRVTLGHARALVDAVEALPAGLPDAVVAKVEERVLARCDGKSVAEFRAHCRRAVLAADPRGAEQRHAATVEQRTVTFGPEAEGMASMYAFLPAADMALIRQRVQACADAINGDDDRSADQRRADVFTDLLAGRDVVTTVPQPIQVIASMSTLRGLSDAPGELDGEPVTAAVVRELANAKDAFWRPVLIDDGHGGLVTAGAHTYRPSAHLRRHIQLRDRTCRFIGCRRRAVRTEIDHIVKFGDGGDTTAENLHLLCKRHHRLKDEATGWRVRRGADGVTHWTSPTHRHYDKPPDPYPGTDFGAAFKTEPDPDPPPY